MDSALQALRHTEELVYHGHSLKVKPRNIKIKSRKKRGSESSETSDQLEPDKKSTQEKPSKEDPDIQPPSSTAMEVEEGQPLSSWEEILGRAQLKVEADDIENLQKLTLVR